EFGLAGDLPLAGDWNGDGIDTIGILRNGFQFLLRNSNSTGAPDLSFAFGTAGDQPIAGDWDGRP
ncbi:MAG: cell surface protein, partial [Thermoanaerobaculia bacterium]